ncbi:MAG: uroporphyrinogen-III synthase [Methanosphaera sp.]|nr:uroporphyrinogen-III synthase [Methanosphaera sp.]
MTAGSLESKKVVITRPKERSNVLAELLEDNGAIPIVVPTLELQLVKSPELIRIASDIESFDWIVFTSPAGVKSFFNVYDGDKIPCKIAVIGIKTEEVLKEYDNTPDLIPESFTAEGLLESFKDIDLKNKKIALPRTLSAREVLPDGLMDYGADVLIAEAYTSAIPKDKSHILELSDLILKGDIDIITFTSPLTVKNLLDVIREYKPDEYEDVLKALREDIIIVSIGPITGKMLANYNLKAIEPKKYTVKDMIETLIENI